MSNINLTVPFIESCWRQLILGFIQGITEFLPISSSAHLKVIPAFLGWGDPGISISASIQLGSIFAVVFYFRRDLLDVFKGFSYAFKENNWKNSRSFLSNAILIGTFPIVIAGGSIKLFWPEYENSPLRSFPSIAIVSIIMGFFLFLAERFGTKLKKLDDIKGSDGLFIGLAQVLALIPGVSRSGITLTAALLLGWERNSAARFSFLLGIPAISIAGLIEVKNSINELSLESIIPFFIGILSAAITSWLAIDFLMRFLQKNSTHIFITYRLFFGVILLVWWLQL